MSSILVVEREKAIAQVIKDHLGHEGYRVTVVINGDEAVQCALREIPSLVILDVTLLGVDCYRMIIQRLRNHPKCMHIPIMVISAQASLSEKIRAYEVGVDSYLTKPPNLEELLAHMRRHLRRMQQSSLSPLTHLPGGIQLECALETKIRSRDPWSVLYLDLDNFKAFNDVYGFLAGNDMILLVGNICQDIVYECGNIDDFVGHVGGDDFVIVTTPEREKGLCSRILARYKEESKSLYRREDLECGSINGSDRRGHPFQFPLVTLSIGVVGDRFHYSPCAVDEVSSVAAEAKRRAKQSSNNISHIWLDDLCYLPRGRVPASRPAQSSNLLNRFQRSLFPFSEENTIAEFK
jgi:diguanylate cyclase (GGDEF)-like protein